MLAIIATSIIAS